MRKCMKKEDGYALIVVLMVMIIVSIMGTVFFNASLSHRKQEARVEAGTISIGAAEMGVRATHYQLRTGIEDLWKPIANRVDRELEDLENELVKRNSSGILPPAGSCPNQDLQQWADCRADGINEKAKSDFRRSVIRYLADYEAKRKDRPIVLDDAVAYQLDRIDKGSTDPEAKKVEASYVISGTEGSRKREVAGHLSVEIPEFLSKADEDRKIVDSVAIDPVTVNNRIMTPPAADISCHAKNYRPPAPCNWPDDETHIEDWIMKHQGYPGLTIILKDICKATGNGNNCNINQTDFMNTTMYVKPTHSSDEMDKGNINKFSRAFMYYDGLFDIQNWNNVKDNNFILRGLNAHGSVNVESSKVAVIGGQDMTLQWKSLAVSDGSTFCINLDGLKEPAPSLFTGKNLSFAGNGKMIFYPSRKYSFLPRENKAVSYTSDYGSFLSKCGISAAGGQSEFTVYGNNRNTSTVETEVDYKQ